MATTHRNARFLMAGERAAIRRLNAWDEADFMAAAERSTAFHAPWVSPPRTTEAFASAVRRSRRRDVRTFLVLSREHRALAGAVTLSQIFLGNFRSCYAGYYAFAPWEGCGLMTEGLQLVVRYAFTKLGLHRVEANIQPANLRSRSLAERCGFRQEGFSPGYLYIDGAWRDHERWAIRAEDLPGSANL